MRRSLGTRLVASTAVGTAVVLVAAGVALYLLVRDGLLDQFDRAMLDKARLLASAVEVDKGKIDLEFDELEMAEFAPGDRAAYLQVWLADGSVRFRSASLDGADLVRPDASSGDEPSFHAVTLPDGRPGRAVNLPFRPRVEDRRTSQGTGDGVPALTMVLTRGTAPVDATLARLKAALLAVGAAAVAAASGVLWVAVRRGLRPVDRLARDIADVDAADLSRRIAVPDAPAELAPVIDRLNLLLERLQAAFERERAFSADVAHELRTPLAGLRSTLEVTLARPRSADEYHETLTRCLGITAQVATMIQHLLVLARLDAGQVEVQPERVSLGRTVRDAWQPLAPRAEARRLRVDLNLDGEADLETDAALVGLIVRNVLENAVVHTDEGGTVRVRAADDDGHVDLRVTNTGSRLTQDEADQAFERFWRGDAARTGTGAHCGLGLTLVGEAVEALGGQVSVTSEKGGAFEIRVRLPRLQREARQGRIGPPAKRQRQGRS